MKTIAIYGSRRQHEHFSRMSSFISSLADEGFSVTVHPKLYGALSRQGNLNRGILCSGELPQDTSLVLSIGGDGTFLRGARWVGEKEIPVLGINTGHLGFLAGCSLDGAVQTVDGFFNGDAVVEERMLLEVECDGLPGDAWPYAINEVAFMKEESASMVTVRTDIDGGFLADYRCDGLIVATPTGSTAYSLSAGGPILEPTLRAIVLSAVAPHSLTVRPLVVGGESCLDFSVDCRAGGFRLSLDSCSYPLKVGTAVKVKRAPFSLKLVRKSDRPFPDVLREKLLWSGSLC